MVAMMRGQEAHGIGAAIYATEALHEFDEDKRLVALYRYLQLDSARDEAFDLLTEAAAEICRAPYATVSLVDRDRVWTKAGIGMPHGNETPRAQACCAHTIAEGDFLEIPNLASDARTVGMSHLRENLGAQMYAGASLVTADGFRIGTLCVMDREPRQLSERQRRLLGGLARQAMSLIELRAHERQLKDALERAEHLASVDSLTGLQNRRVLFERLDLETARARRYGTPLSAVLIDLDHFKRVNDGYGHAAGDAVLRSVGKLIRGAVRASDLAARYGGEEICVLLPQTGPEGAQRFAESLRRKIGAMVHEFDGQRLSVTASLGVASLEPDLVVAEPQALVKAADIALYSAKRQGRDRVVIAA